MPNGIVVLCRNSEPATISVVVGTFFAIKLKRMACPLVKSTLLDNAARSLPSGVLLTLLGECQRRSYWG